MKAELALGTGLLASLEKNIVKARWSGYEISFGVAQKIGEIHLF